MFKVLISVCLVLSFGFASKVQFHGGVVKAHTEVFGDSTIDPESRDIKTDLSMENGITSLKGKIFIKAADLVSDNKDRDDHMHETINVVGHPLISYTIKSVSKDDKSDNSYMLNGVLELHGVKKELDVDAEMVQNDSLINLRSKFSLNMSDFGIKPPVLLFLTVRDRVDIDVNLDLKEK